VLPNKSCEKEREKKKERKKKNGKRSFAYTLVLPQFRVLFKVKGCRSKVLELFVQLGEDVEGVAVRVNGSM